MGIDRLQQMDEEAQKFKQKLLKHINEEIDFLIEMSFHHDRITEADLPIEYGFVAKTPVVRDLLATADEVSALPGYKKLKQICDRHSCAILLRISESGMPNEGLFLQEFFIKIYHCPQIMRAEKE
ncbi:MAG: hypothetical protein WC517_02290 [Patescibacteria group bacterium]